MPAETLYKSLGRRVALAADADPARTEYTADDRETVDNDRVMTGLYSQLGVSAAPGESDRGRTESTKAGGETIDRDRHAPYESSVLFGARDDLYGVLAADPLAGSESSGRTALTESTESIDWDRPPIGPWA